MTNKQRASTKATHADDNLITLEENPRAANRTNDINRKINSLEGNLGVLLAELNEVNTSVETGLEQLSGSNLDLRSRVTETYKRLDEMDQSYKGLSEILDHIDSDVKKLTHEIVDVAQQSETELANLETTSSQQYSQLNEQNEKLVKRVNDLVRHAQETHEQLTGSIRSNTDIMAKLERQVIDEITTLTNSTQERDDKLNTKLGQAEKSIVSNEMNILKMQAIDSALDNRVMALEETTLALNEKSLVQQAALQQLESHSNELAWSIEQLKVQGDKQAEQIIEMQANASLLSRTVVALAGTEKRHFWIASGALVILALVIGLSVYFQNTVNHIEAQQIVGVQTDIDVINSKLQQVNEQLESLDGRMSYTSPFSQFGKDSVIHGPQWLAQQPAGHFAIQIGSSSNKKELYTIAQRYSHYFTEAMSYYTVNTAYGPRYVLVYGSFANGAQASALLWRMPHSINQQRPMITRMGDIQKLI